MNRKGLSLGLAAAAAVCLLSGCASTVQVPVPPRVDLTAYPTIGLVVFDSNAHSDVERLSTQEFLAAVQAAQPGTRIVELGREERVLRSVDRRAWDSRALRDVGQKHAVDAIIIGHVNVEQTRPNFDFSTGWRTLHVSSDVKIALTAKLLETSAGATMWTNSSQASVNIAHAGFDGANGHVGATDPESVYGDLIAGLAHDITDDFRVHYVTRRVSDVQQQVAYVDDRH
jgi:hypothetical protein